MNMTRILKEKIFFVFFVVAVSGCIISCEKVRGLNEIFFVRYSLENNSAEVWKMNPKGGNCRLIIQLSSLLNAGGFSVSRDGKQIVFSTIEKPQEIANIYVVDIDSKNQTKLTENGTNIFPVFSPDGKKIVFSSSKDKGNCQICLIDIKDKNIINLTTNQFDNFSACLSPDSSQIIFVSDRDGNCKIYKMDNDGKNQIELTNNAANNGDPTWSPDGKKIVFVYRHMLAIMDSDGKNLVQFTDEKLGAYEPTWSPDGKQIAFTGSKAGEYSDIYVIDIKTKKITNLTNTPNILETDPCWR